MRSPALYLWRKTSGVHGEAALLELMDGKEPLLALRSAANGSFEVVFRAGISGKVLAHAELVRLLHQGRQIAAGATDS